MTGQTPTTNNRYVTPDIAEFFNRRMRDTAANMNCCLIGKVVSFNAANQTVQAKVNFQKVIKGVIPLPATVGEMANKITDYPDLVEIPVFIYQGGGAYLTMPIAAGDDCLILFHDRDMDIWFQTGQVAPPNSERIHNINDAIAFVGIRNLLKSLANYNTKTASLVDRTGERLAQSGDLKATARSTAPGGWLLCYGQSVSKTTYPDLFDAIGYIYGGSGDNFNVPDLRGRIPVGLDNMGGTSANVLTTPFAPNRNVLGGTIGEEAHLLTGQESGVQAHDHDVIGGNTGNVPGGPVLFDATSVDGEQPTSITGDLDAVEEHQNLQPGIMMNWCIKI